VARSISSGSVNVRSQSRDRLISASQALSAGSSARQRVSQPGSGADLQKASTKSMTSNSKITPKKMSAETTRGSSRKSARRAGAG
jgi:hypothetical protein